MKLFLSFSTKDNAAIFELCLNSGFFIKDVTVISTSIVIGLWHFWINISQFRIKFKIVMISLIQPIRNF